MRGYQGASGNQGKWISYVRHNKTWWVRRGGEEKWKRQESVKGVCVRRIIHAKRRNRTRINEQVATGRSKWRGERPGIMQEQDKENGK